MPTDEAVRLLLVDDDEHARTLYTEYVRHPEPGWGEVSTCTTLREARKRLLDQRFDCILLDLGLPDAQGLEAVEALMRIPPGPALVVLTGAATNDIVDAAVAIGAQDVLQKGEITPTALQRIVTHAISRQKRLNAMALEHATVVQRHASLDAVTRSVGETLAMPLNRISDTLLELVDLVEEPQALASLMAISRDAGRLGQHLDDLLEHARSLSRPTAYQPVALSEAVELGCVVLSDEIDSRGAVIVIQDMPVVWGSPAQLRQVFLQLLRNAIRHHGGSRGAHTEVFAEHYADGVRVVVDDDGPGIPARYRNAVFEPGLQLHPERSVGSGIGLATCRAIVEHHGGSIWIDDSPRGGCRVVLTLPAARRRPRVWQDLDELPGP